MKKQISNLMRAFLFICVWIFTLSLFAQNVTVTGLVTDLGGSPLIGVTIQVQGTTLGTVTGLDGDYILNDVPIDGILEFSYVGMLSQSIRVDGRTIINATLSEDTELLDEVVVVGYGTMRKSDVTGSISVTKGEDMIKNQSFSALDNLRGKAAGVNIFSNSGQPGGDIRVMIRGIGTINSSSNPLYVVDGVVMENFQFLNPNDIERIEVLKDASSAAIYGARGANGVILVTTKRGLTGSEGVNISYQSSLSISNPANFMEVLNAGQWTDTFMEGLKNEKN